MVLQVQNLCKEYPQFSLRDISFQLPEGAIMGLIGENGAAGQRANLCLWTPGSHAAGQGIHRSGVR